MQFTDGIGIQVTKPELAALIQFCGEEDRLANVSIRVRDGRLVAWATDGQNAAYLHGESWDGKGKPSAASQDWQVAAEMAHSIARAMGKDTEAILHVNKKLQLTEAEIKEIESGKSLMKIDLAGHVAEQLDLSLPNFFPSRPPRDTGEVPFETQTFSWGALALLRKVCTAAVTDVVRTFVNSNPVHPIYVEVDTPARMRDDEQPRWICLLAPSSAAEEPAQDTE
jgi:hypothetical protein